jgi:hypothetical protein
MAGAARLPRSTLHGWFDNRIVPYDWDQFSALITALGGRPQEWRPMWQRARAASAGAPPVRKPKPKPRQLGGTTHSDVDVPGYPHADSGPAAEPDGRPGDGDGDGDRDRDGNGDGDAASPPGSGEVAPSSSFSSPPPPRRRHRRRVWAAAMAAVVVAAVVSVVVVARLSAGPADGEAPVDVTTGVVPALVGMEPDQACAALHDAGLTCDPHDGEATREVGVVHTQNHPPGTVLSVGTPVRYTYESTAPLPLRRFQAPAPRTANFVSPTEPAPPGWAAQPSPGWVYRAGEEGVPGLVPIYQFHCTGNCGEAPVYRLSTEASENRNWALDGEAFRCFDPDAPPPPGARPLNTLRHHITFTRAWAVPGTAEYDRIIHSDGSGKFDDHGTLCYIW